jgi:hypothetical protein
LWTLVILVWAVLIAVVAYNYFLRDSVSQQVGNLIGRQLAQQGQSQVGQQIEQGAQAGLPTVVAGLPSGELRVTEQQANGFLASRASSMRPIDGVQVHFVPGELQASISALGTTSTFRSGLAVQGGRIVATDPQVSGMLNQVINVQDLTRSLENQLNAQLDAQGRRVSGVQINQGEMVVNVE